VGVSFVVREGGGGEMCGALGGGGGGGGGGLIGLYDRGSCNGLLGFRTTLREIIFPSINKKKTDSNL